MCDLRDLCKKLAFIFLSFIALYSLKRALQLIGNFDLILIHGRYTIPPSNIAPLLKFLIIKRIPLSKEEILVRDQKYSIKLIFIKGRK